MPQYLLEQDSRIFVFTDPQLYCLVAFLAWVKEQNSTDEKFTKVMESARLIHEGLKGFQQVDSQEIENKLKEIRKILKYFHPDKIASSPFIEFFNNFATDERFDAGVRALVTRQATNGNVAQEVSTMTTSAITKIMDVPESSEAFENRLQQNAREELESRDSGKTKLERAIDKIMGTDEAEHFKSKQAAVSSHDQAVIKYARMVGELLPFLAKILDIKITPIKATEQMKSATNPSTRSERASSEETDGGAEEPSSWFGSFNFPGFGLGTKTEAKASPVRTLDAQELKAKQKYNEQIAAFIEGISLVIDALHKSWVENDPNAFAQLRDNPKVKVMVKLLDDARDEALKEKLYYSFVRYEWLEAAVKAIKENKEPVLVKINLMDVPKVDLFNQLAYHFMMHKGQDTKVLQMFFAGLNAKNASKLQDISNVMQGRFPLRSEAGKKAAKEYADKHGVHSSAEGVKYLHKPKAAQAPQVIPPVPATKWKAAPAKPATQPHSETKPTKVFAPQANTTAKSGELEFQEKARKMREKREAEAEAKKNKPSGGKKG